MIYRCYDETQSQYHNYGARGIEVFSDWRNDSCAFIEWVEENLGTRPEGMTLDRINNDGNYVPGNLRWATAKQQTNNQRRRYLVSDEYYKLLTEPLEWTYSQGSS